MFMHHPREIEIHPLAVGDRRVGQDLELLRDQGEVLVTGRLIRVLGVDDEQADHAHGFLHRHVGVVEERAVLVELELINERLTRRDEVLHQPGHSVLADGDLGLSGDPDA
jgi:hypothetical protein